MGAVPADAPEAFTVDVDRQRLLIRSTLRGLWDLPTVDRYTAAAREALASLAATGALPAAFRLLIDLRQQGVQPREVTERIQANIRDTPSRGARHALLVTPSALHRMQARRVGTPIAARVFTDEAGALEWLFDGTLAQH